MTAVRKSDRSFIGAFLTDLWFGVGVGPSFLGFGLASFLW